MPSVLLKALNFLLFGASLTALVMAFINFLLIIYAFMIINSQAFHTVVKLEENLS